MGQPQSLGQTYKVKLPSGRVLGPLDLERIRLLILKNQIIGKEMARQYPKGDWQDINTFYEIADLLASHAMGELKKPDPAHQIHGGVGGLVAAVDPLAATAMLPGADQPLSTVLLAPLKELSTESEIDTISRQSVSGMPKTQGSHIGQVSHAMEDDGEKTVVGSLSAQETLGETSEAASNQEVSESPELDDDRTRVSAVRSSAPPSKELEEQVGSNAQNAFALSEESSLEEFKSEINPQGHQIAQERTVVFQRSSLSSSLPGKKKQGPKEIIKNIIIAIALGSIGYDAFLAEPDRNVVRHLEPIRPKLPEFVAGTPDPNKSAQIYADAMKYYVADTVTGYRTAADKLRVSAGVDINNVKALAMLASSYLNLIDSSNKDENYFSVISKLIDISRAKGVDLPETVIADVEFFLVVNKAEAAQNRIVEYTKSHQSYGLEMFFYLALTFYARGDAALAARYLNQFPDNKVYSAKIFYLKGLVAEKLHDVDAAMGLYKRAIQFNPNHAKSHLKLAGLMNKQGALKQAAPHLEFLINHIDLVAPRELGLVYYLHAQLAELYQKWDLALGDVERATKLDPENHDYLLELYTLRARSGEALKDAQKQARMYYFLGEGEKLIQQGKYQDALVPFLQAREANKDSIIPLVKIGDMFNYLHDIENARRNYKIAAEKAPDNIQVWSKYIELLIQSYEWDEAKKAMDRFRKMPVSQSAIDKAAADVYQSQGRYVEAQTFYRKAMARDIIDPDVYIAYGKSLMSTRNFKDAPFFFALALRFDPLNISAIISTAKCVAETESIERAISMLQDELKNGTEARAEFLSAIAEFQMQKGNWDQAQENIDQAKIANPDYAYPWKLQALVYMNREGIDRDALDKALFAYKSYSERNTSDPSGYLERFKIYMKKTEFELAKEELSRIYGIYPRFPKLHYYYGRLYAIQGNHKVAAEEYKAENNNNPNNVDNLNEYGNELVELGFPEEALKLYIKAMQLAPESAVAKQNAGWANYKLKHYQAAVTLIQAALNIDKGNPTFYRRLGIVYRDMGDIGSACVSFRKYLQMEPDAPDKGEFAACM